MLEIIAHAEIDGQARQQEKVVLHKRPVACYGIFRAWIPECLTERIRTACEEVHQAAETVEAPKAVQHRRAQSNTVHCAAHLPQMAAVGLNVGVARLVVVFSAMAVAGKGPPKIHQAGDIDSRTCLIIRAQDRASCRCLETQVANALGTKHGDERTNQGVV